MYKKTNILALLFAGALFFNIRLAASQAGLQPKILIIAAAQSSQGKRNKDLAHRVAFYDGNQRVIPGTVNKNQTRSEKDQLTKSLNRIMERYGGDFKWVVDMVGLKNSKIIDARMTARYTVGRLLLSGYTSADGQYQIVQDLAKAQHYFDNIIQQSQLENTSEWRALGQIGLAHVYLAKQMFDYNQIKDLLALARTNEMKRVNPIVYEEAQETWRIVQLELANIAEQTSIFNTKSPEASASNSSAVSPSLSSISSSIKRNNHDVDSDISDDSGSTDQIEPFAKRARTSGQFKIIDETEKTKLLVGLTGYDTDESEQ